MRAARQLSAVVTHRPTVWTRPESQHHVPRPTGGSTTESDTPAPVLRRESGAHWIVVATFASDYRLPTLVSVTTAGRLVGTSGSESVRGYALVLSVAAYCTWEVAQLIPRVVGGLMHQFRRPLHNGTFNNPAVRSMKWVGDVSRLESTICGRRARFSTSWNQRPGRLDEAPGGPQKVRNDETVKCFTELRRSNRRVTPARATRQGRQEADLVAQAAPPGGSDLDADGPPDRAVVDDQEPVRCIIRSDPYPTNRA